MVMLPGLVRSGCSRGAAVLGTLFAVAFAVIAMHGLTPHQHAHGASSSSVLSSITVEHHGVDESGRHHGHGPVAPADAPGEHEPASPAEMCFALVCVLAALVLLILARRLPRRSIALAPRPDRRTPFRSRHPRPPDLHDLSILLC